MMLIPEKLLERLMVIVQWLTVVLIIANIFNIAIKWSAAS
jgi:hypothetical protein